MARHAFSVLCRAVSVDPFTNGFTIHDVAENIVIPIQSTLSPLKGDELHNIVGFDWVFASLVHRSVADTPEELTGRVTIVLPNKRVLEGPIFSVDMKTAPSARNLTRFPALPYACNGNYRLQLQALIDSKWALLGEYVVSVTVEQPALFSGSETE